jgi:FMN reductase
MLTGIEVLGAIAARSSCRSGATLYGVGEEAFVDEIQKQPILIVASSLSTNPKSLTRMLAQAVEGAALGQGVPTRLIDLSACDLPLCAGAHSAAHPVAKEIADAIVVAPAVLLIAPVYNYALNAAAKNLIELTGQSWTDKVVGILSAAGGRSSYMAPLALANSLMLDYGCLIMPRFVYATIDDFDGSQASMAVQRRVKELVEQAVKVAKAIAAVRADHSCNVATAVSESTFGGQ